MREYTVITVPQDLLPQIVGELLSFASNPDYVEVVDGVVGRVIHAHPQVADAWFEARTKIENPEPEPEPERTPEPLPEPVKTPEPVKPLAVSEKIPAKPKTSA